VIVKAKHTSEFFQMENESIRDPSLSWAAKGLLAHLISLPDTWNVHLTELFTRSADGRRATQAAMKELEAAGYVKKEQGKNKRRDTKYTVYETPVR
jgi:DNA-binding MarR family transcriptional regulator